MKEHPRKTYVQDFFEKFPNAPKRNNLSIPKICVRYAYGEIKCHDCNLCVECWNQEMKENG